MNAPGPIVLTTHEPSALARSSFPLTVGVPFARGALSADAPLTIRDAAGRTQPLQSRVMETHDDGSVRWLLLDYQADMPSLGRVEHTLVAGEKSPEASVGQCIELQQQGDVLLVDNGALKIEMNRQAFAPLQRVWKGGDLVSDGGLESAVITDDGREFSASRDNDVRFEIEEQGPLRLAVRWEGVHRDETGAGHLDYDVRLTIYAGQPFVRVDHVFTNRMDPPTANVKSIVARLPVRVGDGPTYQIAYPDPNDAIDRDACHGTDQPVQVQQFGLEQVNLASVNGQIVSEAKYLMHVRALSRGWGDVSGKSRGVMLAARDFWQNYPKAITVRPDAIEYHLVPDRGEPFEIPRGMAKTHTSFLHFHDGRGEPAPRNDLASVLQRWPMPAAATNHYARCGELWDYFRYDPKRHQRLELALRELFYGDMRMPPPGQTGRAYGLKHYGDYLVQSLPEWSLEPDSPDAYYLNNEYDGAHVYAMQFLRTREVAQWWAAEAHALHTMDVDTCHHAVAMDNIPDMRFMDRTQYRHCFQHVGSIQVPNDPEHQSARGSHTFLEGVIDYYHLTGDRRAREVAVATGIGMGHMAQFYDWGMDRSTGWGMMVLAAAYGVEPDEEIRKGAEAMIDRLYEQLHITEDGIEDPFDGKPVADRGVNLCMRGLIHWHQVTADPRCEKLIVKMMDSYVQHGFLDEGVPFANWLSEHRHMTSPTQGFANLESLAYAYRLTGDRKFIDAGLGTFCQAVAWILDPDEKDLDCFSIRMLRGPMPFLAVADELGLLEKVPGVGRWLET